MVLWCRKLPGSHVRLDTASCLNIGPLGLFLVGDSTPDWTERGHTSIMDLFCTKLSTYINLTMLFGVRLFPGKDNRYLEGKVTLNGETTTGEWVDWVSENCSVKKKDPKISFKNSGLI